MDVLASGQLRRCGLVTDHDTALTGLGIVQLSLQLRDVRIELLELAVDVFHLDVQVFDLVGNSAEWIADYYDDALGRSGSNFHQRVFHFLDHQADDLFRILRLFQHGVDIGVNDVAESGKNTHDLAPAMRFSANVKAGFVPSLRACLTVCFK